MQFDQAIEIPSVSTNSSLPGMRLAMLNWPPMRSSESNSVTLWPRFAAVVAAARPAGPAPTTAIFLGFGRLDHHLGLATGARVDQAAGLFVFEHVVQTGLVAGDAGVDFVGPAVASALTTQSGSARKGRAMEIMSASPSASTFSAVSGMLMRLVVTSGIDDVAHLARHPGECRTRYRSGDRRDAGFVPADAGIDDGRARLLDRLAQLYNFFVAVAVGQHVEHGQPVDDDEFAADRFARPATISTGTRMRFSNGRPIRRCGCWCAAPGTG